MFKGVKESPYLINDFVSVNRPYFGKMYLLLICNKLSSDTHTLNFLH